MSMKKVFIYYSLTGNGDEVAKYLSKEMDIEKIITKEELPRFKFLRIMTGGFKALVNHKDKLEKYKSLDNYDEIFIGSPIWNSRFSSPINTILSDKSLHSKKLVFILYSASGESLKATERIKEEFKDATIINLKEPRINKKELIKLNFLIK